jgi:HD-GYP domain-containing protein (c-di-GMP phosphodiesterase class II)
MPLKNRLPILDILNEKLLAGPSTLSERLNQLHDRLLNQFPKIDRIACALYEPKDDVLKTFINSTRAGIAISGYEYKLSQSRSLSEMARTGGWRVLSEIPQAVAPDTTHSQWLLQQGYRSSYTLPMYNGDALIGFIFFDSMQPGSFDEVTQRDLAIFCNLVNMTISSELSAVRAIVGAAHLMRDIADLRDFETGMHLERMSRHARLIAKDIGPARGLPDEFVEHVYLFAPLHDIGKIGIPDAILLKPGALTPEERVIMRQHVDKGVEIIQRVIAEFDIHTISDINVMRDVVASHHEFLDGSGYPRGLMGDDVPVAARIVTVADILDALMNKRPYKEPWGVEQCCAELNRLAEAGKLDRGCVAAVLGNIAEITDINRRFQDGA